jgi:hypothetical protein
MLDEKGSASALEQSEAPTMLQGGERSPLQDFFSSLPPQTDTGEISTFPHALGPSLEMPGGDEQTLGNITSTDHSTDRSPTTTLDIRPADECSTRNEGSASSPLDESRGREAWIVLGAVLAALVVGFGGGLASYRYLIPEAPSLLQHATSSVPIEKPESTIPKNAMLSLDPTPGAGSQSVRDPRPTVGAPDRTVITSPAAVQTNVASGNAVKSASGNAVKPAYGNAIKPATQPTSLPRPGTLEREPVPQPVPETRPITIEGWTVRDVRGDAIVLKGPNGVRNVMRGDTVPGVGRIDSVVRWGSRWVVSTTSGLIATP